MTLSEGTNLLVGTDPAKIVAATMEVLAGKGRPAKSLLCETARQPDELSKFCSDWYPRKSTLIDSNSSGTCPPKGLAPLASFLYSHKSEYCD